jgi:hypothetical protein
MLPPLERLEQITPGTVFSTEQANKSPLPEDCLIRGQIWNQSYFPENWFAQEHDGEDRYLKLDSTVKSRTERVLGLGHHLATVSTNHICLQYLSDNTSSIAGSLIIPTHIHFLSSTWTALLNGRPHLRYRSNLPIQSCN